MAVCTELIDFSLVLYLVGGAALAKVFRIKLVWLLWKCVIYRDGLYSLTWF